MNNGHQQDLWPYEEAKRLLKRHNHDQQKVYLFETGFGPSGFPHIGTFGEVVRTYFIILAMRDLGHKTRLISFSDDMDGLRKVPEDVPQGLQSYLGRPVSLIPDPFACCDSFAAHMNNKLKSLLDDIGIEYEFKSSFEEYRKGTFNEALAVLIKNHELVEEIILPTLSEETQQSWFPFLPMCEICKNVLTTRVTSASKKTLEVQYKCDRQVGQFSGCDHEGACSVLNGSGKMTWKVDWALRWKTFGVDYELYGKDLIESYKISSQIMSKVFKTRGPEHMFYEMFLDEDGSKISKSKGKGLTVEDWLRYGSQKSLRYLMFHKPRKAKELSLRIIPRYMNEVNDLAEHYYSNGEKKDSHCQAYKLLTFFRPPVRKPFTFDYSLLCNLLGTVGVEDSAIIKNYIFKVSPEAREFAEEEIDQFIRLARSYYKDVVVPTYVEAEIDEKGALLLRQLLAYLEAERSDEEIHNKIYEIARTNNFEPQRFFSLVYKVLLKQERGPRLGHFINLLGAKRVREIISTAIDSSTKSSHDDIASDQKHPTG